MWNYRVLVYEDGEGNLFHEIEEVYYSGPTEKYPQSHCSCSVNGKNTKDITWVLENMKKALSKPYLYGDNRFPKEYVEEEDNDVCGVCNGSGEGQWDGSSCHECKGSGVCKK